MGDFRQITLVDHKGRELFDVVTNIPGLHLIHLLNVWLDQTDDFSKRSFIEFVRSQFPLGDDNYIFANWIALLYTLLDKLDLLSEEAYWE